VSEPLPLFGCPTCGDDRYIERDGVAVPCPECTGDDHALRARRTDPEQSEKAGAEVQEREGSTGVVRPGTHKHRILSVYQRAEWPLTDYQAWTGAGLSVRSSAWHRCSDLLDAKLIHQVGVVEDPETKKEVRRCAITMLGREALRLLDAGKEWRLSSNR
jgi:hypothetical protein